MPSPKSTSIFHIGWQTDRRLLWMIDINRQVDNNPGRSRLLKLPGPGLDVAAAVRIDFYPG